MTEKEKLALVYRITSGYTIIKNYVVDTPTDSLLNESLAVYEETLYKNRFEDLITKEFAKNVLIANGLWKPSDDNNLVELDKSLDSAKLELYDNNGMPKGQIEAIKKRIELIKKAKDKTLAIKHSLDRYTLEGLADYNTEMYVFSKVVLNKNYETIQLNPIALEILISEYKLCWPSNTDLRLVARSEPWRSFWVMNPECFRVKGHEQQALIMFSKMYDAISEHPHRPDESVINDDDMLDGWFLSEKKKMDAERGKSKQNVLTNRHPRAQEIFVTSVDKKGRPLSETEIKEIANMNDMRGKLIQKEISTTKRRSTRYGHSDNKIRGTKWTERIS